MSYNRNKKRIQITQKGGQADKMAAIGATGST